MSLFAGPLAVVTSRVGPQTDGSARKGLIPYVDILQRDSCLTCCRIGRGNFLFADPRFVFRGRSEESRSRSASTGGSPVAGKPLRSAPEPTLFVTVLWQVDRNKSLSAKQLPSSSTVRYSGGTRTAIYLPVPFSSSFSSSSSFLPPLFFLTRLVEPILRALDLCHLNDFRSIFLGETRRSRQAITFVIARRRLHKKSRPNHVLRLTV